MNDLQQMIRMLNGQIKRQSGRGDWPPLQYTVKEERTGVFVRVHTLEVGFKFSVVGKLIGAYNWKE